MNKQPEDSAKSPASDLPVFRAASPLPGSWVQKEAQPQQSQMPEGMQDSKKEHQEQGSQRSRTPRARREPSEAEKRRRAAVEAFPFVAVTVAGTGIHPASSRLITFDAVTFNNKGELGECKHVVFNPDADPGPWHQHGLSREEIAEGIPFAKAMRQLDYILDGRTLITHDAPLTWGYIVAESRRALAAAARANRGRNRGRNLNKRRRNKFGHTPQPVAIVDTLATARRREVFFRDIRLAAVAITSGLSAPAPEANTERGKLPEDQTSRDLTHVLRQLYAFQSATGEVSSYAPNELRADKFGLQRSHVRVDAQEAPRLHHNPGTYKPGKELVRGMEFVVAPEVHIDPDELIAAGVREELNYSEKLTRDTSFVVCNATQDLVGKPMHAKRKDIPLLSDEAFLAALERIEEPGPKPEAPVPPSQRTAPRRLSSRPRRTTSRRTIKADRPTTAVETAASSTAAPAAPETGTPAKTGNNNPRRRRRRHSNSGSAQDTLRNRQQRQQHPQRSASHGTTTQNNSDTTSANLDNAPRTNGESSRNSSQTRRPARRNRGRRGGRNRNTRSSSNTQHSQSSDAKQTKGQ
ncbi:MAG: DNA polymerase III subunit epsilon [Corynebacterium sp.]|nr:DNA polymerase III subunit epsilon [Corynebacterium sp.]